MQKVDYKEKIIELCDKLCTGSNDFVVCYGLCLRSHGFSEKEVIEEVRRTILEGKRL